MDIYLTNVQRSAGSSELDMYLGNFEIETLCPTITEQGTTPVEMYTTPTTSSPQYTPSSTPQHPTLQYSSLFSPTGEGEEEEEESTLQYNIHSPNIKEECVSPNYSPTTHGSGTTTETYSTTPRGAPGEQDPLEHHISTSPTKPLFTPPTSTTKPRTQPPSSSSYRTTLRRSRFRDECRRNPGTKKEKSMNKMVSKIKKEMLSSDDNIETSSLNSAESASYNSVEFYKVSVRIRSQIYMTSLSRAIFTISGLMLCRWQCGKAPSWGSKSSGINFSTK